MATPPTFTSGEVLTAAQMNAVGLWKITSTSFSGSSSVSVNNCFSSDYQNYKVVISSYGSIASFTRWRLRAGGTDTTSAIYFRFGFSTAWNSGTLTPYNGGLETSFVPASQYGNTIADSGMTEITIFNPFSSTLKTSASINIIDPSTAASYVLNQALGATTSFDGFTIYPNGGTISGTITVYGMRN